MRAVTTITGQLDWLLEMHFSSLIEIEMISDHSDVIACFKKVFNIVNPCNALWTCRHVQLYATKSDTKKQPLKKKNN